jgi:hypothetical protein
MTLTLLGCRPVVLESADVRIVEYILMTNSKDVLSTKTILQEKTVVVLSRDSTISSI